MTSIMPGAFPQDEEESVFIKELNLNSSHVKKLRLQKFTKECFKSFDVIVIVQILIVYFIDNSIIKLLLRYSLQYFLLNLNTILDDLLLMNEQTFTNNLEEVNARDSLNNLINNLKSGYKLSLKIGILLFNIFCIVTHFFTINTSDKDEYLYGFCFINLIGQLKLNHIYPIIIMDLLIMIQQFILYNFKFNNIKQDDDSIDDGYQGDLKIYEIDLLPNLNKNFLVEFIGWDMGYTIGDTTTSYGSV